MTPIPLSKVADPSQVEVLRPRLEGRSCVVVGSAPLSSRYADVQPYETVIAVNGGIGSVPAVTDLWVIGSKPYDDQGAHPRELHRRMLDQCKGKSVTHALFLRQPKIATEALTLGQGLR